MTGNIQFLKALRNAGALPFEVWKSRSLRYRKIKDGNVPTVVDSKWLVTKTIVFLLYLGDYTTQLYRDYNISISNYKDPSEPIGILESHVRVQRQNVARFLLCSCKNQVQLGCCMGKKHFTDQIGKTSSAWTKTSGQKLSSIFCPWRAAKNVDAMHLISETFVVFAAEAKNCPEVLILHISARWLSKKCVGGLRKSWLTTSDHNAGCL